MKFIFTLLFLTAGISLSAKWNNTTGSQCNIYAREYENICVTQRALNGVPVSAGTNQQHYTFQEQYHINFMPALPSENFFL